MCAIIWTQLLHYAPQCVLVAQEDCRAYLEAKPLVGGGLNRRFCKSKFL